MVQRLVAAWKWHWLVICALPVNIKGRKAGLSGMTDGVG